MNDSTPQMISQAELLRRISEGRAQFEATWRGLSEAQMIARPGPQADWSVKDVIGHISWWEDRSIRLVEALVGEDPAPPWQEVDAANEATFEANKDRPLADILAEFEANGPRVVALVRTLSDEQINTPGMYNTFDNHPLLPFIAGDTYEHYDDHLAELKSYVDRLD